MNRSVGRRESRPDAVPSTRDSAGPVVEFSGIARVFGGLAPTIALRPTDLEIWPGEFVAISGASGSGKSTLLSILGLLDAPSEGSYRLAGCDVAGLRDVDRTALRGQLIGFVFQSFRLLGYRTAVENVGMSSLYRRTRRRDRDAAAVEALRRVGLGHRLWATPATMSGGEQQRVAVARAIVNRPALLLCDEPTGNLDSANTAAIMDLLDRLNHVDGLTIVMVTHDAAVAARASRQIVMSDGSIVTLAGAP